MKTGQTIRLILDNYPGATKAKLARALGVTYTTVYNWENDKTKMTYPVYLIFRELYPHLEITDVIGAKDYTLGNVELPERALPTKQAFSYILAKDPQASKTRLAKALGCTPKSLSNYTMGKTRIRESIYVGFRKLYPSIEITDVYYA